MNSNAERVYRAFLSGTIARPASALWTDGDTLYSYETAIITRTHDVTPNGPRFVVNVTSYSKTTSAHRNGCVALLKGSYVTVDNIPKGTNGRELLEAASVLVDCGSCGGQHRAAYTGDCRNDAERF